MKSPRMVLRPDHNRASGRAGVVQMSAERVTQLDGSELASVMVYFLMSAIALELVVLED